MSEGAVVEPVLPSDLVIGTATASWQVEGDVAGRGRCIWDDFAEVPGAIVDGTTGEPACDHLRRIDEDIALISDLGFDAYRFSVSWPRVQPEGRGDFSDAGLDVYDRLVDRLLERGIEPIVTLYHWDLPSELPGWTDRETPERFARYVGFVADRLADRVSRWATLNEPWVSAYLGYASGIHAPGARDPQAAISAAYHLMLGHGLGMRELRRAQAREAGIVLNLIPVLPESPAAVPAARHIDGLHNRFFLDLLAGRGVPGDVIASTEGVCDWKFLRDDDLALIAEPIDWLGENYYTVMRVAVADSAGAELDAYPASPGARFVPRDPVTEMGWEVYPDGLVEALSMAAAALPGVPLWVTENGAATQDDVDVEGVRDPARVDYYREHMRALLRAREAGIDVRGYLAWSLLDNIEWAEGFTKRFGIVRVDPVTLDRVPKDSARWWQARLAER